MSEEKSLTKDTRAIIIAIVMAVVAIVGINKSDIGELRAEMRDEIRDLRAAISANTAAIAKLEGILLAHIAGHSHGTKVAVAGTE